MAVRRIFKQIVKFLVEVRTELRKVSWTDRKELVASTSMVIVTVLIIAIFVFAVDLPLSRLMEYILKFVR